MTTDTALAHRPHHRQPRSQPHGRGPRRAARAARRRPRGPRRRHAPATSHPVVLPAAFAADPEGPDEDGTLYVHGSVAAGWLRGASDTTICVTVTQLDGLVAGAFRLPPLDELPLRGRHRAGPDGRGPRGGAARACELIVDHMVPGRSATLRPAQPQGAGRHRRCWPSRCTRRRSRCAPAVRSTSRRTSRPGSGAATCPCAWWPASPVADDDAVGAAPDDVRRRAAALAAR